MSTQTTPKPLKLPKSKPQFKTLWGPFVMPGAGRTLLIGDIHVPYHDEDALMLALNYGKDRRATRIILNGDICDFYAVSDYLRDPRLRNLQHEIATTRDFFAYLRQEFPAAHIVLKIGNHEERWERHLITKAPDLAGIDDFSLKSVLRLDDYGINLVENKRPIRVGKVNVIHGHEYKCGATDVANPARFYFQKSKVHVIGGDKHRSSQHSENNLEGKVTSAWSIGCLCDMRPAYMPLNNWNHGFAFVETDGAGEFHVDNLKIIDGKIY